MSWIFLCFPRSTISYQTQLFFWCTQNFSTIFQSNLFWHPSSFPNICHMFVGWTPHTSLRENPTQLFDGCFHPAIIIIIQSTNLSSILVLKQWCHPISNISRYYTCIFLLGEWCSFDFSPVGAGRVFLCHLQGIFMEYPFLYGLNSHPWFLMVGYPLVISYIAIENDNL